LFGTANAMYFGCNHFLPDYLTAHDRTDLIWGALTALNVGQLPASLLLLVGAERLEGRIWPYFGLGTLAMLGAITVAVTASGWTVAAAATIGFACAGVLVLTLSLPPLLCAPADVARTSAAMFTISYTLGMVIAVLSGAAWDVTGIPSMAFLPIGLCALLPFAVPATLPHAREDQISRS